MAVATLYQSQREQFVDSDGKPIVNGKLYVGQPNLDPVTNQISVYASKSDALRARNPLAQPIRTDQYGRPSQSVWINESYSYAVYTSTDVLQVTEDEIEVLDIAALVQEEVDAAVTGLGASRNDFINGGMLVVDRDDPSAVNLSTSFQQAPILGFYGRTSVASGGTLDQGTEAGFGVTGKHAVFAGMTLPDSTDFIEAQARIASVDARRFVNRPCTGSMVVRHNFGVAAEFTLSLVKADAPDDFTTTTTIGTGEAVNVASGVATTLEFSVEDMGDCSNGVALVLRADSGAIVDKSLLITNVQIEQNNERTPFVSPTYAEVFTALYPYADRDIIGYPAGYLDGLDLSIAVDTDHDITIAAGSCRDSSDALNIDLTSALTKQLDAAWAEGTNAGGLPSGVTLSGDEWLYFFVIGKDDGTVDAGFDDNASATNLLSDSGYTSYCHIGSVFIDASSNILDGGVINNKDIGKGLTVMTLTSSLTLPAPPNVSVYKRVLLVGGGGGGSSAQPGTDGGSTTIDAVYTAGGGTGAAASSAGAAGTGGKPSVTSVDSTQLMTVKYGQDGFSGIDGSVIGWGGEAGWIDWIADEWPQITGGGPGQLGGGANGANTNFAGGGGGAAILLMNYPATSSLTVTIGAGGTNPNAFDAGDGFVRLEI